MSGITIQLPILDAEHSVEIEVRVNGKSRRWNYRVELLDWDECEEPPEIRIQCLRKKIDTMGEEWQLVSIGAPGDKSVPIMFRRKEEVSPSDN